MVCTLVSKTHFALFASSKEKTLLFIVIRDHVGSAPLDSLAKTFQADLEKIWDGLSKV